MRLTVTPTEHALSAPQTAVPRAWSFLQRELLYLCWGVMDVALLTPFALALMGWARYWPPVVVFCWLLLLMGLSFNLARLMSALELAPTYQQTIMAVALAGLLFFSLRGLLYEPQSLLDAGWIGQFFQSLNTPGNLLWQRDVLLFLLIILMWARGIQMAHRLVTIGRIGLRLRLGGLLIAPFVIWVSSRNLLWPATPFILLFFLAGLTAVALTRAEEIAREERGTSASLTPRWFFFIFLAAGLVVFGGGALAILVSGEPGTAVVGRLAPLWQAGQATLVVITATIGFVLEPVLALLVGLITAVGRLFLFIWEWASLLFIVLGKIYGKLFPTEWAPALSELPEQTGAPADQPLLVEEAPEIASGLGIGGQTIVVLLAVAVILMVALLLQRRYQATAVAARATGRAGGTTRPKDEAGLMQRLFGRFGGWRQWHTAVSIRRIYRQMLRTAAASGYPKTEAETPYEYLTTLSQAWPHNQADTRLITEAYVKVRYGEVPENEAEMTQIQGAWTRLEQARPVQNGPN